MEFSDYSHNKRGRKLFCLMIDARDRSAKTNIFASRINFLTRQTEFSSFTEINLEIKLSQDLRKSFSLARKCSNESENKKKRKAWVQLLVSPDSPQFRAGKLRDLVMFSALGGWDGYDEPHLPHGNVGLFFPLPLFLSSIDYGGPDCVKNPLEMSKRKRAE